MPAPWDYSGILELVKSGRPPVVGQRGLGNKVWGGEDRGWIDAPNAHDPNQRADWAEQKTKTTEEKMSKYADYLLGPQRRGEVLGQNFRMAGARRGTANEYMASLAAKGITNPTISSKFLAEQQRDLSGEVFSAANQQSRADQGIAAGILGQVYGGQLQTQNYWEQRGAMEDQRNRESTDFGDLLGSIGGTILGGVTGGFAGALGSSVFGGAKKLFGGILGLSADENNGDVPGWGAFKRRMEG